MSLQPLQAFALDFGFTGAFDLAAGLGLIAADLGLAAVLAFTAFALDFGFTGYITLNPDSIGLWRITALNWGKRAAISKVGPLPTD